MFVIGSNRKEFENQGVNCIMSAVREMVAPIYKHLFVLIYSHLCFNVGSAPVIFLDGNSSILSAIGQTL